MMKHHALLTTLTLSLFILSSCSRYYGVKKALPETDDRHMTTRSAVHPPAHESVAGEEVLFIADAGAADEMQDVIKLDSRVATEPVPDKKGSALLDSPNMDRPDISEKHNPGVMISVPVPWAEEELKMDGMAIAGFVTGIVGLFIFGYVLGAIAIVFSAISLSRIAKKPEIFKGKGLATTGLILGIVDVVLLTIILLAL